MIWVKFNRLHFTLSHFFVFDRIYTRQDRWTPFVRVRKRFHSWFGYWGGSGEFLARLLERPGYMFINLAAQLRERQAQQAMDVFSNRYERHGNRYERPKR